MEIPRLLRTSLIAAVSLLAVSSSAGSEPAAQDEAPRPNIIYILADDLGWGDLGCFGSRILRTPGLDRMAEEGMRFTQYYVNASVCSPSRVAMVTGQFPGRHGMHHNSGFARRIEGNDTYWLKASAVTLPGLLQQSGYATAHFGKWHLGDGEGAPDVVDYGFDEFRGYHGNGPSFDGRLFGPNLTRDIIDAGINFMERHPDSPVYLNLWFNDVHAPLIPSEEQLAEYPELMTQEGFRTSLQTYAAAVSEMDKQIGRLLDWLDAEGLSKDTLVVFGSDNGPEQKFTVHASPHNGGHPGPFRGSKGSIYDGGVRSPLIVRWPGQVPANRVDNESILSGVDFLPTFTALAGVDLPVDYRPDGEDVSAALLGQPIARNQPIYWRLPAEPMPQPIDASPMLAVRDGRWKLLANPDASRIELYDMEASTMEVDDVSVRHPEIAERLFRQLVEWENTLQLGATHPRAGSNQYPWPEPL